MLQKKTWMKIIQIPDHLYRILIIGVEQNINILLTKAKTFTLKNWTIQGFYWIFKWYAGCLWKYWEVKPKQGMSCINSIWWYNHWYDK